MEWTELGAGEVRCSIDCRVAVGSVLLSEVLPPGSRNASLDFSRLRLAEIMKRVVTKCTDVLTICSFKYPVSL